MTAKLRGAEADPLTQVERGRVTALAESLRRLEVDGPPALESYLPELRQLLGAQFTAAFGAGELAAGFGLTFQVLSGSAPTTGNLVEEMDEFMHRSPSRWALYDPRAPEPRQRNTVVNVGRYLELVAKEAESEDLRAFGVSRQVLNVARERLGRAERLPSVSWLIRQHQLRALICEGSTLLAWVGAVDGAGFGPREEALLAATVPALQRRLSLERRLEDAQVTANGFVAALDALAEPAFLVDARGHLQHANREGQAWVERDRREVMELLIRAARGEAAGVRVVPLAGEGPGHLLVIAERIGDEHPRKVERFCDRHHFTPREKQVLALVTRGEPNRRIATELGCSEKTVELHITHLLRKCTVTSRTELVAEFWSH
jgi:DNA-binding CsgD family transcriptional regulator